MLMLLSDVDIRIQRRKSKSFFNSNQSRTMMLLWIVVYGYWHFSRLFPARNAFDWSEDWIWCQGGVVGQGALAPRPTTPPRHQIQCSDQSKALLGGKAKKRWQWPYSILSLSQNKGDHPFLFVSFAIISFAYWLCCSPTPSLSSSLIEKIVK